MRSGIAALLVLTLAAAAEAQDVVRLRSGKHLCGTITIDESVRDGFTVALWDTGGTVFVKWSQVPVGEARRLQNRTVAPVIAAAVGDILDGIRIITASREVIGVLTGETASLIHVKTAGSTAPMAIPTSAILKRESLKVQETEAYSPAEMIDKRAEGDLTPDQLAALGDFARALKVYDRAKEFYAKAAEADPARKETMDELIAQVDVLIREDAAEKALAAILKLEEETKYQEALEAAQKFEAEFEGTETAKRNADLVTRVEAEKKEFETNRDKILAQRIPELWRSIRNTLWSKYAGRRFDLGEARAGVEKIDADITAAVTAKIRCTPEEVEKFWAAREQKNITASMADGSWIYKGGQDGGVDWSGESQKKNTPSDDFARRFGLNSGGQGGGKDKAEGRKLQTSDEWWRRASGMTRLDWLQCYYGLTSGSVKKVKTDEKDCTFCRGKGTGRAARGGKEADVICPRCHGAKLDVSVTFW